MVAALKPATPAWTTWQGGVAVFSSLHLLLLLLLPVYSRSAGRGISPRIEHTVSLQRLQPHRCSPNLSTGHHSGCFTRSCESPCLQPGPEGDTWAFRQAVRGLVAAVRDAATNHQDSQWLAGARAECLAQVGGRTPLTSCHMCTASAQLGPRLPRGLCDTCCLMLRCGRWLISYQHGRFEYMSEACASWADFGH